MSMTRAISVVIPVHNEAGNIVPLHDELTSVLRTIPGEHQVIYVNDGSTDSSLTELRSLTGATIIDLNRNYGQATALDAGFHAAQGELVVSMDGDGQNDPRDIPRLIEKLEREQLDVVAGWRKTRSDKNGIKILTRIGRLLRNLFINDPVHDSGCTLRVYTNIAVKSLDIGGEMHRYILALLRWQGYTIGELEVNDRMRVHGRSKYGYMKAIRGGIDLLYIWFMYKYFERPLHLFGYGSIGMFVCGIGCSIITVYQKVVNGLSVNRNGWFFLTAFFFLTAVILFSFGIVIDLLVRLQTRRLPERKLYLIRNTFVN